MEAVAHTDLRVRVSYRQILSMSLPITLAILIPQINLLVNSIFLGHYSEEALGNAGVTGVFYLIFAVSGHGLSNAMQSVFSRYAGSGKPEFFATILTQGIRISLLFAGVFMLFTWLIAPLILREIADPAAFPAEMRFLNIRIVGLPFLFLFQLGNAFLIATLNSRFLIIAFVIEAAFNILFDYLLIFGKAGMPALGFQGAAWASIIAECSGMIAVFVVILMTGLKKKYRLFESFIYNAVVLRQILQIAIPLMLQYMLSLTTWLVFFLMIEVRGTMAKAISNTMRNVFGIAGIFTWAFSGTCNTMVSNLIGQGKKKIVLLAVQKITLLSFGCCLIIVVLLNIFPDYFFRLFSNETAFWENGVPVIRMVSAGMLLMSVSNVWLNALTGTGQTRINLFIEILAIMLYLIYTWYFMHLHYVSLAMAWSNELIYWGVILVASMWFMRSGRWKSAAQPTA
jgi:MATE family multidrug resistance protein